MTIKDLTKRKERNLPVGRGKHEHSLFSPQREMNRLFDSFFHGFELAPFREFQTVPLARFTPRVNVSETEKEVLVSAELPGMNEKDIGVELEDGALTIRGEKKEEHEEKGKNWHRIEQSYGSFHRVVPLPARADAGKAKANFKKGVLNVTLPKLPEEQNSKKSIEITTE